MAARTQISARRLLTVGYSSYPRKRDRWPPPQAVPYLRLRGHWLKLAGFAVGQKVTLHIADGCITIIPSTEI
ncbi:type I toxin-antitoxin system SymE family toxin [Xanthomonas vasicola]|uniref:SymE family type I addiction module toxin n=1 Tax=Xanthomonas vasicola TaxID=56459 RepID=UPI0009B8997B|nr:SymE family type I addiction module toxin [Xanthomonas vasicola]AZR34674.1 type I toxin-antitoxin system SymE family toxin [Xanthomonas vasicola]MBV6748309.1 type I toxin-antitoxin system SymE family toxin [Xanthomonas vasicola pv. vasculorum NCPPB 890]MBV6893955.1 type I toxin-antitoxin system SymE family toxin [Xanthomonas vasicola pv. vasculorum]MDO6949742.1 SymE family type I addiction module toxin [Xanthomonas vasicola]MDO6951788.1 SymE family type I addiction module toxin [Xanthomonas